VPPVVDVKGLVETQRKLEQTIADLRGDAFLQGMRDATLMVSRSAKERAPVDTGRLRATITPEIRREGNTTLGVVGSNVKYAAAVELGSKPHFPPLAALENWARRHGTTAYVVARAIARRGTKAKRFLQGAFDENKDAIVRKLGDVVGRIVNK